MVQWRVDRPSDLNDEGAGGAVGVGEGAWGEGAGAEGAGAEGGMSGAGGTGIQAVGSDHDPDEKERRAAAVEWLRWAVERKELREYAPSEGRALGKATLDLRSTLHLNVAAAALNSEDFELAESASRFVLHDKPSNPKGMYRLAVAQAGRGEYKPALRTLSKLLGLPGQGGNKDARKLVATLREKAC